MATEYESSSSTVSISKSQLQKYTPINSRLIEQIILFIRLLNNEGDSEKWHLPGIEIAATGCGANLIGSDNIKTHR